MADLSNLKKRSSFGSLILPLMKHNVHTLSFLIPPIIAAPIIVCCQAMGQVLNKKPINVENLGLFFIVGSSPLV